MKDDIVGDLLRMHASLAPTRHARVCQAEYDRIEQATRRDGVTHLAGLEVRVSEGVPVGMAVLVEGHTPVAVVDLTSKDGTPARVPTLADVAAIIARNWRPSPAGKAETREGRPECPGPDCKACNGEWCDRHSPLRQPCDCDVLDRHDPAPSKEA